MQPAALREHLLRHSPGTRLESIRPDIETKMRSAYPWLPDDYWIFLKQVGWGVIGNSSYMIYEGPMEPGGLFDAATAGALEGVVLVGDDFAENCEAYLKHGTECIFGTVSKEDGVFSPHSERRFIDFLTSWYGER